MARTPKRMGYGEGGGTTPQLTPVLNDIAADLDELRTQFIALLEKLDDDAGITDTDYEAELTPAARLHLASNE